MPKIVVPVGYPTGITHPIEPTDEVWAEILIRNEAAELPEAAYRLWRMGFTDAKRHAEHGFTRAHLIQVGADAGVEDAEIVVDRLFESELLAEYDPEDDTGIEFLRKHTLHPCGEGVGNSPEDPSMFGVAQNGETILLLEHDMYVFWSGSIRARSMWHCVRDYRQHASSGMRFGAEQLSALFAGSVPVILAAGAGYLDLV